MDGAGTCTKGTSSSSESATERKGTEVKDRGRRPGTRPINELN